MAKYLADFCNVDDCPCLFEPGYLFEYTDEELKTRVDEERERAEAEEGEPAKPGRLVAFLWVL